MIDHAARSPARFRRKEGRQAGCEHQAALGAATASGAEVNLGDIAGITRMTSAVRA